MIRKLEEKDLHAVINIWFHGNMEAHNFISENYWKEKLPEVKSTLPEAEVYIYENENKIKGFIGIIDKVANYRIYNPDWAVLIKPNLNKDEQKLYFIIKTKGYLFAEERRETENLKIKCGKEYFKAINTGIDFRVANNF
ncbi:MAG: hypothetical protein ACRCRV_01485 [Cetobacterium sp.]